MIASSYLCGEWPRPNHPLIHLNLVRCPPIVLTADKWTQTVDDLDEQEVDSLMVQQPLIQRRLDPPGVNCGHTPSGFREIRPRLSHPARASPLACSGCGSPVSERDLTVTASCTGFSSAVPRSRAIAIPAVNRRNPLAPCQGSAEGFNQEIEKLVHFTGVADSSLDRSKTRALTPDGHRAPIADLLNNRSVNTQTPSGGLCQSGIERHFLCILEDSDDSPSLPIIPGAGGETPASFFNRPTSAESDKSDQCERVVSGSVSPTSFIPLKTSGKREGPEGSEKIEVEFGKTNEVPIRKEICHELPTSPMATNGIRKCLIPSERSAFCPLLKKYVSQQTRPSFSLSANESDFGRIEAK